MKVVETFMCLQLKGSAVSELLITPKYKNHTFLTSNFNCKGVISKHFSMLVTDVDRGQ